VLQAHAVRQEDFRRSGLLKVKGSRRPLRARIEGAKIRPGADDRGEHLVLTFTAPGGCYATSVLREIMKTDF
jgi:tRNA pseudouridine13 synthase